MRRGSTIFALACLLASIAKAEEAPIERAFIRTQWRLLPAEGFSPAEKVASDEDIILRQAVLPVGLAVLEDEVIAPEQLTLVRAGTQLILASLGGRSATYCAVDSERVLPTGEVKRQLPAATLCLIDGDRDGKFDHAYRAPMTSTIIPAVQDRTPKRASVVSVRYRVVPPETIAGDFWVGVQYRQYFNIYGNRMLFTALGGRGGVATLSSFKTFKSKGAYPQYEEVMGAKITLLEPLEKSTRLRVETTMTPMTFTPFFSPGTTVYVPVYR